MKNRFIRLFAVIVAVMISISCAGCQLFELDESNNIGGSSGDVPSYGSLPQDVTLDTIDGRTLLSRVEAVAKVERSVVAIKMTNSSGTASGSGVIIGNGNDNDNVFYIITCHHVISSQGDITVYVPDKNARNFGDEDYNSNFVFTGTIDNTIRKNEVVSLIGGDQLKDVAVLKFDVTNTKVSKDDIVYANIAPEDENVYKMQRGEQVFAVGNPGGELPMTVSSGTISYLDRELLIGSVGYMTLMQIDVPTNHGSSGGGLFNDYGELIGITNAGNDSMEGIKYAIPYKNTYFDGGFVGDVKQLIATYYGWDELNHGFIEGSWSFGITISSSSTTATIMEVVAGSNAYNAGIKKDDLITKISFNKGGLKYSKDIQSKAHLEESMNVLKKYLKVGDSFSITIERSFYPITKTVNLTEQFIFGDTGYRISNESQEQVA